MIFTTEVRVIIRMFQLLSKTIFAMNLIYYIHFKDMNMKWNAFVASANKFRRMIPHKIRKTHDGMINTENPNIIFFIYLIFHLNQTKLFRMILIY